MNACVSFKHLLSTTPNPCTSRNGLRYSVSNPSPSPLPLSSFIFLHTSTRPHIHIYLTLQWENYGHKTDTDTKQVTMIGSRLRKRGMNRSSVNKSTAREFALPHVVWYSDRKHALTMVAQDHWRGEKRIEENGYNENELWEIKFEVKKTNC